MSWQQRPTPPDTGVTVPPSYTDAAGGAVPPPQDDGETLGEAPPHRPSHALQWTIVALTLVAAIMAARYWLFTVRELQVAGIRYVPKGMVEHALGMEKNLFFFTLTEDYVRNSINANRYLQYVGMEKKFPNTLYVEVRERQPLAFFTYLGMGYVLAQDGVVLEQSRDLTRGGSLITVFGLSVWGQIASGSVPQASNLGQVSHLSSILAALLEWGFDSQVQSVDVGQPSSLSLMTYDGFLINLGDSSNLGAKIGTAQAVIAELRRIGTPGGILECSKPGEASFRVSTQ